MKITTVLNKVNAAVLRKCRCEMEDHLDEADETEIKRIRYYFEAGQAAGKRDPLKAMKLIRYSPHSDEGLYFMTGYYDVVYENHSCASRNLPLRWEDKS